jgi:hypothetical protein
MAKVVDRIHREDRTRARFIPECRKKSVANFHRLVRQM